MTLDRETVRNKLNKLDFNSLFINDLGWDNGGHKIEIQIEENTYHLNPIAQKRGMVAFSLESDLTNDVLKRVERKLSERVHEHIIINITTDHSKQNWWWVKREIGQSNKFRKTSFELGQDGEPLIQKLEQIKFTLEEEESLTISEVSGRVRATFDVEKVTKSFYDNFKRERDRFLEKIQGFRTQSDLEWYASIMLNRLMFLYFIQKKNFLDNDQNYLQTRLNSIQSKYGEGEFYKFYKIFLLKLFHEGLSKPLSHRSNELKNMIGNIPYLNGGIFDKHELESENANIEIPDDAFKDIFDFFDSYQWHLDDRTLRNDREINPDVLGYIFERYINQKQMGAFYTKEDITSYISNNTIIPSLFDEAIKSCPIAFDVNGGVWKILKENPDRYIHRNLRHGINYDIYKNIELNDILILPDQMNIKEDADQKYGLTSETWGEVLLRRKKYDNTFSKLANGEVNSVEKLISYNINLEQFIHDTILFSEGPELVRAFWKALQKLSILDPTCGSGAFLFAALNILEPVYFSCIESMEGFIEDSQRSERLQHLEPLRDFQRIISEVNSHKNKSYFVLKSIIVNNLFGVDIMEEAVEICKLRLFLKLVSNLDIADHIEPLPDIDFNIRVGNTLIGFSSIDQVEIAMGDDMFKKLSLPKIKNKANEVENIISDFQNFQLSNTNDILTISNKKKILKEKINELRFELDKYLSEDYGINLNNLQKFNEWKSSHQPFHWIVEFYNIMNEGGFSVIIGNPPYVEISRIKNYSLKNYNLLKTGNLFSLCFERFLDLLGNHKRYGIIVPISSVSTSRMVPLMELIIMKSEIYVSNFSDRPGKLFTGVDMNLTIFLGNIAKDKKDKRIFSTIYNRWKEPQRKYLFDNLIYTKSSFSKKHESILKVGNKSEAMLFEKIAKHETLESYLKKESQKNTSTIYYHSGGRYFRKCIKEKLSNEYKPLTIDVNHEHFVICLLSSSLFYWFWIVISDCFHVNKSKIFSMPVPTTLPNDVQFKKLSQKFLTDIERNCETRQRTRADGSIQTEKNYIIRKSKKILDEIDHALSSHYKLNEDELNFIINYDGKHRITEN